MVMKKVLIIDERFPNTGGTRTEKFVKYLPQYGWEPIILTIDQRTLNPFYEEIVKNYVDSNLKIYGTKTLPTFSLLKKVNANRLSGILNSYFFIPDMSIAWIPYGLKRGINIIQKEMPQIIYSTSPSEGVHVLAYLLKKKFNLPWVADFRDLWTLYDGRYKRLTFMHHIINLYIERSIYLRWCDLIIANTEKNKDIVIKHFRVPSDKIRVITNGFDPEDSLLPTKKNGKKDNMVLGYLGGFEKVALCYREFLSGFEKAVQTEESIFLELWSVISEQLRYEIEKNKLISDRIIFHHYMSHQSSMKAIETADVLVVLLRSNYPHVVPQKLYNYLALRKPILAVIPPNGSAAEVIRETNSGIIVSPDDVRGISNGILNLYKKWRNGTIGVHLNENALQKYQRDELTKKLATSFEEQTYRHIWQSSK